MVFRCEGDNLEEIPESIAEKTGLTFPMAHCTKESISLLSRELKEYKKDTLCRVPFCVTVEAETLGANIKLGDMKTGPRVESYAFSSIEELSNLKPMDLEKGRIKEVLASVEELSSRGETVALSVEGPFTIMSSLIDPMIFYRAMRKEKEQVLRLLKVIEDSLVNYILEGINKGAKIISYGDPVGALEIVGPKVYKEYSGSTTYNILKRVEHRLGEAVVHICGKTSTAFESMGLSKAEAVYLEGDLTYGEAIDRILQYRKDIKFIGNACIKRTPLKMKAPVIWKIELNRLS